MKQKIAANPSSISKYSVELEITFELILIQRVSKGALVWKELTLCNLVSNQKITSGFQKYIFLIFTVEAQNCLCVDFLI